MNRTSSTSSLSTAGAVIASSSATALSTTSDPCRSVKSAKSATLAYLTSYENMVRMQDDECDKTASFMKEAVDRLRDLGRRADDDADASSSLSPEGMLTYLEMRRALLRMGFTWNRSSSSSHYYDDDDVSVAASEVSKSSRVSGASGKVWGGNKRKKRHVVSTDNQLIMLLSVLVEMEERWRVESGCHDDEEEEEPVNVLEKGLFLPELVQAYKLVIGGMQSLQSLNNDNTTTTDIDVHSDQELADRLRQRTKGLLRSFGPNHKTHTSLLLSPSSTKKNPSGKQCRDGLLSSPKKQLFSSSSPDHRRTTKTITDAAFHTPRLGEDSIRKLMHTKDATLAKIVEEHEVEMDVIVHTMEVLKQNEESIRSILIKKGRITRLLVGVGVVSIFGAGWYREQQRKAWVRAQIIMGREEERAKSAAEIENLIQRRDVLQKKLDTAEGTARYQRTRLEEVERVNNQTLEEIAVVEQKWWLEQAEMGRCQSTTEDVEGKIEMLTSSIEELTEERGWCSNRLQGRDAELNSLRYAKSDDDLGTLERGGLVLLSRAADNAAEGSNSYSSNPVKLEMKYNKSVRNAMVLRQVYSGAGGVAAGVVLRAIFPGAFSFLTLPAIHVAQPATKKAAVVIPKKKLGVNVKWVDRIHAATVVLLVVRTALLFFMP